MPFEKDNQLAKGKGRKGYAYEKEQLEEMIKILNRALVTTSRMQLGEASTQERINYEDTKDMVKNIFKTMHATKTESKVEIEGELPFQIIEIGKLKKDDGE